MVGDDQLNQFRRRSRRGRWLLLVLLAFLHRV
jgi:hypothetical protein